MNDKAMNLNEFTELLDLYGSATEAWPPQRREAATRLLKVDQQARLLLQQQSQLDETLAQLPLPEFPGLEHRIIQQALPQRRPSPLDSFIEWLIPHRTPQLWRPVLASCLPLVFGILLGNYFSFGVSEQQLADDYWSDELYILALNDYNEGL